MPYYNLNRTDTMKKILVFLSIILLLLAALYAVRRPVQRWALEKALNTAGREFFHGSLRLKSGTLDRSLKMRLDHLEGKLVSETGPAPVQLETLQFEKPIHAFFSPDGTAVSFTGLKPQGSSNPGLSGRTEIRSQAGGSYHFESKIEGLDLSEITWLNPDNLTGSKGFFTGTITADGKFTEAPHFQLILVSKDGLVQSKFFNILFPYLPAMPTKEKMAKLSKAGEVVPFRDAAVRLELPEPRKLKIALHIQIPDYNVVLNINFEVHLEESLSFLELAQIAGLVKVKI